jgi:hypothetical protein
MIRFHFGADWYFLRSYFDEDKDDYSDFYDVYIVPFRTEEEFKANPYYWAELTNAVHLGQIPIAEIGLDDTRRRSIDASIIGQWLSAHKR